jgi:hypothetical protein
MNADEIKALIDLPESARVKLAAIPGPGWGVRLRDGMLEAVCERDL